MLQTYSTGLAMSGVITSVLRFVTKAAFGDSRSGIRKGACKKLINRHEYCCVTMQELHHVLRSMINGIGFFYSYHESLVGVDLMLLCNHSDVLRHFRVRRASGVPVIRCCLSQGANSQAIPYECAPAGRSHGEGRSGCSWVAN